MAKTPEEALNRFRSRLEMDFKGMDIKNKDLLSNLMFNRGYHATGMKTDHGKVTHFKKPTQKQLDFAWRTLTEMGTIKPATITGHYETYTYRGYEHRIRRADRELILHGKTYRKGQFIPLRQ